METENTSNRELALKILQEKTNYAFEGGGVLGIAHVGALVRLYELGGLNSVDHTVGTSVGSIIATGLACGATPYYIKHKVMNMDLKKFKDGGNWISRIFRFIFRFGLHKGKEIERYMGQVLEELTGNSDITSEEAYSKYKTHLTITYLSMKYRQTRYADHITEPNNKLKTNVLWSSSIPLFYQAARRCKKRKIIDLLVDGGVTDNYPIHVLRDQKCNPQSILGFKLYNSDEEIYPNNSEKKEYKLPRNIIRYGETQVNILRDQALRYHVHSEDWKLTCKINVGKFKTTDFDITEEDKLWLYNSGRQGMDKHLKEIEELLDKCEYPL
jgi:predicted acylesterase/phospholipase RssA